MASVVAFLKGVNVGGHKTFRPTALADSLRRLGAVNVGAAGTFVFTRPPGRRRLREEISRRLPFEAQVAFIEGTTVLALLAEEPFRELAPRKDLIRFVSVLTRRPRGTPALPMDLPGHGDWLVRIIDRRDRLLLGLYRRQMKAIGVLGRLDTLFGAPATTRSWSTFVAVARVLQDSK